MRNSTPGSAKWPFCFNKEKKKDLSDCLFHIKRRNNCCTLRAQPGEVLHFWGESSPPCPLLLLWGLCACEHGSRSEEDSGPEASRCGPTVSAARRKGKLLFISPLIISVVALGGRQDAMFATCSCSCRQRCNSSSCCSARSGGQSCTLHKPTPPKTMLPPPLKVIFSP